MRLIHKDPGKGYVDSMMWVPKQSVNVEGVKNALTFEFHDKESVREVILWNETDTHLVVPRSFWRPQDYPFNFVDARPKKFSKATIVSRIKLDHLPNEKTGELKPTGKDDQRRAFKALLGAEGGTLQLACVAGDTVLNLNRGGKGFKMTIAEAYSRLRDESRYKWNQDIPTYIRSCTGDRIGLNRVMTVVDKGWRIVRQLTLVDGKKLKATDDHEVLTPNGYRTLGQLQTGDEVITDGRRTESVRKKKLAYKRVGGFKHHPYARHQSRSYVVEEHRAIMEASLNGLTLNQFQERCRYGTIHGLYFIDPSKYHVHHKDENIKNNRLNNLEVLPAADHLKKHRPGSQAFGLGELVPVKIQSVDNYGEMKVYDVVCEAPHHNFVADGIIVHNCGKGKTVIALHFAAALGVPAIICVDNTQLLYQWQEEIARHLIVPEGIGLIQAQEYSWKKPIVMATYQTLANRADDMPEEIRRWFGLVIWDEGHHVNAPTFSKSAPLFYGYRLALTATPTRTDGLHIICQFHVGDIIFKDVIQELPPRIIFKWTGMLPDWSDPQVRELTEDKNRELHLNKMAGYFGQWQKRLDYVLKLVAELAAEDRKILVLSNSVDEVINLKVLWDSKKPKAGLYTDVPIPTIQEVGFNVPPVELEKGKLEQLQKLREGSWERLSKAKLNKRQKELLKKRIAEIDLRLEQHSAYKAIAKEHRHRQRQYIKKLLKPKSSAGVFTQSVKPAVRAKMLKECQVIFAIMKYGKEGLDDKDLDTVIASEPVSDRNTVQQIMGRPGRPKKGKKPLLIFLEDIVEPMVNQCRTIRRHLRSWPLDEGGPFDYELVDHPAIRRREAWKQKKISLRAPG